MNKSEILSEITERLDILEATMVSTEGVREKNIVRGKIRALKIIKDEINILDMEPKIIAEILEKKFENRELGIEGQYVREGFEVIVKEYTSTEK